MAIPINVEDLINQRIVEPNRIEFKRDFNPTPILHSICAFANDNEKQLHYENQALKCLKNLSNHLQPTQGLPVMPRPGL